MNLRVERGPPRATGVLGVSIGARSFDLGALGPLMLDPAAMVLIPLALDAGGDGSVVTPPLSSSAVGWTVYAQALVGDFTNALAIRISN